jgi:DNA-binding protein YbaB
MFGKLKQLKDLRDQAKKMQTALAGENVTAEKNGVTLVMSGNMEVTSLKISEELKGAHLESALKDCFNDALKRTQKIMAKKMQEMGGFPGLN